MLFFLYLFQPHLFLHHLFQPHLSFLFETIMTTVRKHSSRRYHAPNRGRTFPNAPRQRNQKRMGKGLKKIHVHQNTHILDLESSMKFNKPKAIYGWMRSRSNMLMSSLHRTEHFHPGFTETKEGQAQLAEIANLQRSLHHLEYILAEDEKKTVYLIQKTTFPTFQKFYSSGSEDMQEVYNVIITCLSHMSQEDRRYASVFEHFSHNSK